MRIKGRMKGRNRWEFLAGGCCDTRSLLKAVELSKERVNVLKLSVLDVELVE